MDKPELLATLRAGHARLRETIDGLSDADLDLPAHGSWSRRDLVAHLEWWERHSARVVHALRAGREPYGRDEPFDLDAQNAQILEESRGRPPADVRRGEEAAWEELLAHLEAASDEDLFDADRFAWTDGRPLSETIRGDTDLHWSEHLPDLQGQAAPGAT